MNELFSNAKSIGMICILQSIKEMIEDGDDISTVDFDYLIEEETRNISDPELLEAVIEARQERNSGERLEVKPK